MPDENLGGVETASSAVAAQMRALVEARYVMAIRRPRDMDAVREKMLKECRRPSFAAVARYRKPIGRDESKWPTGPSIRFAESAVRNMTNVSIDSATVYDDREKRIIRVSVVDLESNVPYAMDVPVQKTVERRNTKPGDTVIRERTNTHGDRLYVLEATDDDIANKSAALVSKAVRTLALRLIPGDIIDECMTTIVLTQTTEDAKDPDTARRKLLDSFGSIGVRVDQLKSYLGHDVGTLSPKELQTLRELYAAIRDGESTWRDVMEEREAAGVAPTGIDAVRQAAAIAKKPPASPAVKKPAPEKAQPAPAATTDPETGEILAGEPESVTVNEAAIAARLQAISDIEILDLAGDELRDLPEGPRERMQEIYRIKREALAT